MDPQRRPATTRNPPFRLQLVLPAPAALPSISQHHLQRWLPAPSLASPPPQPQPQQQQQRRSSTPYAQLLQLSRRHRLRPTASSSDVDATRPSSSDSGISDCGCSATEPTQSAELKSADGHGAVPPACRICLTSLSTVGPSAAANCGHVACLPCLLTWYRTRTVCFCCRSATTGFTLLYL